MGIYKLVHVKDNGEKTVVKYHNFTVATNSLLRLNSGRIYQSGRLVAEL